ncbi:TetR/AcrR family transcriptional regulator [Nonomuraea sp. NPDC049419]|uniref:TetR/AcrR family transcriptional regulator n=1 Tax=Nonomuraea sp. NPDC049419 TaxID=3155772 RepID=UPI00342F1619
MSTPYQLAQREGQSVVRAAVLDAAKHLLISEGPAALTVRRIAAEAGCSTKVIYTLFGGKDGLSEALWLEGFARLEQRLLAVPREEGPLDRLMAVLGAYRAYALAEPDYYRVMFLGALPGFRAGEEATRTAKHTFGLLVASVAACLEAGELAGGAAAEIADLLWMAVHGAVSLEIMSYFEEADASPRYRLLCTSVLTRFLPAHDRRS